MSKLLKEYIRLALDEVTPARVPQQLISPDASSDKETEDQADGHTEEENDNSVKEFSGAGAIVGYALPLGMQPTDTRVKRKNFLKKS
jgi:hypothetical protein